MFSNSKHREFSNNITQVRPFNIVYENKSHGVLFDQGVPYMGYNICVDPMAYSHYVREDKRPQTLWLSYVIRDLGLSYCYTFDTYNILKKTVTFTYYYFLLTTIFFFIFYWVCY